MSANRFIFGRGWVFQAPAGDDTTSGGGGGDDTVSGGDDTVDGGGEDTVTGGEDNDTLAGGKGNDTVDPNEPKDMLEAITAVTGGKKPEPKVEEKRETETHYASGKPKKNDKGESIGEDGKVIQKPKEKSVAELTAPLSDAERKTLTPASQGRFAELSKAVKTLDEKLAAANAEVEPLKQAREALVGAMQDTGTTQEMLVNLLEFNGMRQSSDPKELEQALKFLNTLRVPILTALGIEEGDVDLLKDFPDLAKEVEEERMTRPYALEVAKGRRAEKLRQQQADATRSAETKKSEQARAHKQAADAALDDIEKWTRQLQTDDLDYKAKEDILLPKLQGVMKDYQPAQWLPTLKLLYAGIVIKKDQSTQTRQQRPLRPSAARAGEPAPTDMKQAIDQALGYTAQQK